MYLEEAARTLLANRIRAFLTVIGLIIGVASVVSIQVLGAGVSGAIRGLLAGLSDRSFVVFPQAEQRDAQRAAVTITDLSALKQIVPEITSAIPAGGRREVVHAGHARGRLVIYPDSETRFADAPLASGRAIGADDVAAGAAVAVLSNRAYTSLFGENDAIGKSVYAGTNRYVVIGVEAAPNTGLVNVNFNGDVGIPYTTYLKRYVGTKLVYAGRFTAADGVPIKAAENAVIAALRVRHKAESQYQIFDKESTSKGIDGIFRVLTLVVALIGAVSLLVAGIGIMNIMLVSVTERTREIGIRKAIGARRGQIVLQFITEALLLASTGCALGLALGLLLGWTVNRFAIIALTGHIVALPWLQAALTAVSFATAVTLVFGSYPAYRASRLDPIEALRRE